MIRMASPPREALGLFSVTTQHPAAVKQTLVTAVENTLRVALTVGAPEPDWPFPPFCCGCAVRSKRRRIQRQAPNCYPSVSLAIYPGLLRLLFAVGAVTISRIRMKARYHAWVLLLALSCAGVPQILRLVPLNSSAACCGSSACCMRNCSAGSHHIPSGEALCGATHSGRRRALCTCSVSPNPSYLVVATHSQFYLEPPRAVLVPALDPLLTLSVSHLLPLQDGHGRPPDQPPRVQ